jgi:hypothetical protein
VIGPWHVRATQRCWRCEYDVTQTLQDGFRRCPECGSEISGESCERDVEFLPRRARRWIYASWLAPIVVAAVTVELRPRLLWVIAPICVAGVLAGWWWIERWLSGRGALGRAWLPALLILLIDSLLVIGLLLVLAAAGLRPRPV